MEINKAEIMAEIRKGLKQINSIIILMEQKKEISLSLLSLMRRELMNIIELLEKLA